MHKENNKSKIKVIIVDDHKIFNEGIKKVLSSSSQIDVVAIANNGEEALKLIKESSPNLIITDMLMPVMNGMELLEQVRMEYKDNIKVLMFTAVDDDFFINQAINVGADGYLSKRISSAELIDAVLKINSGTRVFSSDIIDELLLENDEKEVSKEKIVSITHREHEILEKISKGKTSQEIADELYISRRTVEAHRYNIIQKLTLKNSSDLIRYAIKYSELF